jgi:serine/threonine-protein kinase
MTQAGLILGTAAYMSPEQAKGKPVDRRSDIWAFGCVLYEMLSGRRAFGGDDVTETLAEVIKSHPDWSALPDATPTSLCRVIARCLAKDSRERLRDIGDVRLLLDDVGVDDVRADTSAGSTALWRRAIPFAATIAVTGAVVFGIDRLRTPGSVPPEVVRFSIALGPESTGADALLPVHSGETHDFVLAHDGRAILYNATFAGSGRQVVAIRRFDHSKGMPVTGSDGDGAPFVSPDGKWLGFVDAPEIKKVPLAGGAALTVTRLQGAATATWLETGTIVFSSNRGLLSVPDTGGEPRQVTTIDASLGETYHRWPVAVSGSVVAFVTITGDPRTARLALADTASGRITRSELPGTYPRPLSDRALVYAGLNGSLHIVPIDAKQLAFTGSPTTLPERVNIKSSAAAAFDVGRDGRLIFAPNVPGLSNRSLVWVDRQGKEVPLTAPPRAYFYARVSPDGQRLSLDIRDENQDIWTWDTRGTLSRVTRSSESEQYGLWTPDGQWLIYATTQQGKQTLYRARANGIGSPELIAEVAGAYPNAVTADGKQIIFRSEVGTKGANDLLTISIDGEHAIKPLIATEFDELNAAVSPDGRWVAFQSNLSGRMEIYVRPFPDVNAGQWTVSTGGGLKPAWGPDGRELFYISFDNKFMVVPLTTGASLAPGAPRVLFETSPYLAQGAGRNYDVSRDGQRFVMIKNAAIDSGDVINVTLNWAADVTGARTTR